MIVLWIRIYVKTKEKIFYRIGQRTPGTTMSAQQLQAVFQELDYLDDGYEDGLVSHVGLRRIILETPELEADLGPTFTRALLARAEQNIYGRLTFEEFLLLAREVAVYTHGYRQQQQQQHQHPNSAPHNPYVRCMKSSIRLSN